MSQMVYPVASNPSPSSRPSRSLDLELELLQAILATQVTYPWHPLSPDGQQYLDAQETQAWAEAAPPEADLQTAWQALQREATTCWAGAGASFNSALLGALFAQFGQQVPLPLLAQLGQQVEALLHQGDALMDRMVAAALTVLDGWDTDDLRVVARPLALAMRDGDGMEVVMATLGNRPWSDLSEVEQARLSLAIARYGFDYLGR